ncbi:MAG: acyl-CoA dehydrogenase family protein [Shewanella psychromarinicola]|jgi:acyl-CoA dehydrogenase|uniref:Acyl-CoA dehydrogenase n=1 Tax=Shewanella psychromarinicola TaxID=2487742 RepID=A0A3N4E1D3_9GAMM|nr:MULTISPECIES: acyl-CoA dehydrogenase family protein [Shewanella]AZG36184.1 acyl-CoA dehydrogenase [Shewanella psychromarinicola]MCL1082902.1 acyl-CoA dehydrogenase family protein [Shewanella psychromarinicola]PKG77478.1 acyl-CoA dehydrogenase [Shewanella sp. Actino-trap-3]RPA31873.1 acyl-CoA dehydrogenase [Shewanella psychromarinicola]|tara:strand:+ start:29121 stop:30332 length:1212 start_codon:yes stop_codon:yes gene_type:complete
MNFEYSEKVQALIKRVNDFMDLHVFPVEEEMHKQVQLEPWSTPPLMEQLKAKAKAEGLWNLFLPVAYGKYSAGLTNLEYAPLAEIMGKVMWAPEVFNCAAPDTGNMEVLAKYGNEAQKKQWLEPLLDGKIRSAFAMTEPDVASSDATNIELRIERDGDEYVINGRKFYISGACRKQCEIMIVMGKTDPGNSNRYIQQSQVLVPMNAPGVTLVRPMKVFGYDDSPEGHGDVIFDNVRVPVENIIAGEGKGFEIAQGRLGPGRIHHCMRSVGVAQRALDLMCQRVSQRIVFGQPMIKQQSVREDIAKSACQIEQARLMTLKAAQKMDTEGNKAAKELIAMIKIVAPSMSLDVIDRAIQCHGAVGVSQDTFLAHAWAGQRTLRLADGPDQVHMMQLGRDLVKKIAN